ncbi:hypothetical protein BDP55DRAFT_716694 [Colletotrichum godetiae]|uniref:Uncharacterized protein n=1 Tax=Colletotrichum godetiae TaxID=1209918 RepID=A0AAJ0AHV7_9PEZI|nr:uncharacterized protein BDP55DRAFT_716694 [Colletotrichum godetiae]KAK1674175.1 hypothetical protein BDP55DRAFT_716694 [Colletotrichum godetiae]
MSIFADFKDKCSFPSLKELSSRPPDVRNHWCTLAEIQNAIVIESNTYLTVYDTEGHKLSVLVMGSSKSNDDNYLSTGHTIAILYPFYDYTAVLNKRDHIHVDQHSCYRVFPVSLSKLIHFNQDLYKHNGQDKAQRYACSKTSDAHVECKQC